MRRALALTALTLVLLPASALAQALAHVSPDDAAKHVISAPKASYPPLAAQARIEGNVILGLSIGPTGKPVDIRLVRGHPMLVTAAIEAVKNWTYQPFVVDGKPTTVQTFVMVAVGNPPKPDAVDRAEMKFQNDFWTSEDSAEDALAKGDLSRAQAELSLNKDLGSTDKDLQHIPERWQWMTSMGRLCWDQNKYDEAEHFYKDALTLRSNAPEGKGSFGAGESMANLADFYAAAKKPELARDQAEQALAIFEKLFKNPGLGNQAAKRVYGENAARESWLLLKLARQRNDAADIAELCHAMVDFQEVLSAEQRDFLSAACQPAGH